MKITHKMVTPKDAHDMLKNQHHGHPAIDVSKVDKYAEAMNLGAWRGTTGRGIVITKGKLTNGRHRLLALIKTGKPLPLKIETIC